MTSEPRVGAMKAGMGVKDLAVANLGLVVNVVAWGTFFPVLELLLKRWDMFSATAARQVVGVFALYLMLTLVERRSPFRRGLPWRTITFLGFVGITLGSLVTSLAVYLSSGLSAAIISATNPIGSMLLARALYGVPLTRAVAVGAVLSVAGGALAVMAGSRGQLGFGLGEFFIIVANLMWTWFSLAVQDKLKGYSQLEWTAYTLLPAAITLVVLVAALGLSGTVELKMDFSWPALGYIAWLGVVPIAVGNYLWIWGVSRIGVTIAAMYQNLIPVTAVLLTLWIGIYPSWQQLAGGALILAGVVYAQKAPKAKTAA